MSAPPAFQFYAKAWLSSTKPLSLAAKGAYIDLLAWSWDNGPLPAADAGRARLLGCSPAALRRLWDEIADKWVMTDGGYVNKRLEQQRAEREAFIRMQVEKGRAGAAARHGNGHSHGHAPAMPVPQPKVSSPVSSLQSPVSDQDLKIKTVSAEPKNGSTPALLTFPTVGAAKEWGLTQETLSDWRELYPTIDVLAECRKALAWVQAKPENRKTAKGMPRFLVSWFNRSSDRATTVIRRGVPETRGERNSDAWDRAGEALNALTERRQQQAEERPQIALHPPAGQRGR